MGAFKFDLRIFTKPTWEELRAEYSLIVKSWLIKLIREGEISVYGRGGKGYAGEIHDQEEQEDPRRTNQFQVQNGARTQSRSSRSAAIAANDSLTLLASISTLLRTLPGVLCLCATSIPRRIKRLCWVFFCMLGDQL